MAREDKTKEELLEEVALLKKRIAEFEAADAERKKAEEGLGDAKVFTESALNAIDDIFYAFDLKGKFLRWNKAFSGVSGYSDNEMSSMSATDFFEGQDVSRISEAIERVFKEGHSTQEADLVSKDRRKIPYEFTGFLLKDGFGDVIGFAGIGRDITERKNREALILSLSEQQQTMLDASPAMIFYKDKENRFVRVNEAFVKASGISKKELEGKTCWDLYSREMADRYWQDDKEVMASGKPKLNIIESMETPKGRIWVQTDKILYRDPQGAIIGIIGFTLDITEQRKSEGALQQKIKELGSFNKIAVDRELKMIELKEKLKKFEKEGIA